MKMDSATTMLRMGLVVTLMSLICSCEKTDDTDKKVLYDNSFEHAFNLNHFQGFPTLSQEASPHGGKRSLYVSGGCLAPHVWVEVGPWRAKERIELRFMARAGASGTVCIYVTGLPESKVYCFIDSSQWKQYYSSTLTVSSNSTITIEFSSGGIVFDEMWIDELVVRRK